MRRFLTLLSLTVIAVSTAVLAVGNGGPSHSRQVPPAANLRPTVHRPVPADVQRSWLVPPAGWHPPRADQWTAARNLARAAALIEAEKPVQALALIHVSALASTPLSRLRSLSQGAGRARPETRRGGPTDLRRAAQIAGPAGFLYKAASLRLADAAESRRDFTAAMAICEELLTLKPAAPEDLLLRLARAASNAGNRARALAA